MSVEMKNLIIGGTTYEIVDEEARETIEDMVGNVATKDEIPTKTSQLDNDSGYITGYTETDPTVPSWAKAANKPSYTKSEVGLGNVDNVKQYSENNPPPYPVASVNGKTGEVKLTASDVGARSSSWMPTASQVGAVPNARTVNGKALSDDIALTAEDVGARPDTWTPTYSDVGADKNGAASSAVSGHNTNTAAHNDIRLLITALTTRLDALANSDDDTLDQMAEVVAYIKANRDLIDQITTGKVSVSDIVNNLTTNVANKPLSAAQGVALKALIDAITVPTKLSQLTNDKGFISSYTETDPTVPSWAKASKKPSYTGDEIEVDLVEWQNPMDYEGSVTAILRSLDKLIAAIEVPTKLSDLTNNVGFITGYTETDPTVPSWAKAASKPSYTASEVGAVPTSRTVNGKKLSSNITLAASDVSAVPTSSALTVTGVDANGVTHTWTMYGVAN